MKQVNDKLTKIEEKVDYLTKMVEHLVESSPASGRSEDHIAATEKLVETMKNVGSMFAGVPPGNKGKDPNDLHKQATGLVRSMIDQSANLASAQLKAQKETRASFSSKK
jgi:hypothetical protein